LRLIFAMYTLVCFVAENIKVYRLGVVVYATLILTIFQKELLCNVFVNTPFLKTTYKIVNLYPICENLCPFFLYTQIPS